MDAARQRLEASGVAVAANVPASSGAAGWEPSLEGRSLSVVEPDRFIDWIAPGAPEGTAPASVQPGLELLFFPLVRLESVERDLPNASVFAAIAGAIVLLPPLGARDDGRTAARVRQALVAPPPQNAGEPAFVADARDGVVKRSGPPPAAPPSMPAFAYAFWWTETRDGGAVQVVAPIPHDAP